MSFRCGECGEPQPTGTTPQPTVTEVRERNYGGGQGWDVVAEKNLCEVCVGWVVDAGAAEQAKRTAHVMTPATESPKPLRVSMGSHAAAN